MRSHNVSPSARAANGSVTSIIRVEKLLEVVKENYPNCCRIVFATIMESQKRKLQEHYTTSITSNVQRNTERSTARIAVSLHKIEKSRIVGHNTDIVSDGSPYPLPASTIRLVDLFASVNVEDGRLLKYIPGGFLNDAQLAAKQTALEEQREYVDKKNSGKKSIKATNNYVERAKEYREKYGARCSESPRRGKRLCSRTLSVIPL